MSGLSLIFGFGFDFDNLKTPRAAPDMSSGHLQQPTDE
jgi:hypothetical protein